MNIDTTSQINTKNTNTSTNTTSSTKSVINEGANFADELSNLKVNQKDKIAKNDTNTENSQQTELSATESKLSPADTELSSADTELSSADTKLSPADTKLSSADTNEKNIQLPLQNNIDKTINNADAAGINIKQTEVLSVNETLNQSDTIAMNEEQVEVSDDNKVLSKVAPIELNTEPEKVLNIDTNLNNNVEISTENINSGSPIVGIYPGENSDDNQKPDNDINTIFNGLQNAVEEMKKTKQNVNHLEENSLNSVENNKEFPDKNIKEQDLYKYDDSNEENELINNDMNVQENQDKFIPQMNAQMNFNSNGQPFSEFVQQAPNEKLASSESDLAEENAILSTMDENIAMANKNMVLNQNKPTQQNLKVKNDVNIITKIVAQETPDVEPAEKIVETEQGIKKVDTQTNITVETIVKYDTLTISNEDAEFFIQLVENGSVEMPSQTTGTAKSSQVSKALADLIAKSMNENQPVRIDFDNDISIIIKVSKDGKISADFLPSSQVAEAYLKENLPILRQRFDDNNIDYDELNQRKQQRQNDKDNRKKGRKDE